MRDSPSYSKSTDSLQIKSDKASFWVQQAMVLQRQGKEKCQVLFPVKVYPVPLGIAQLMLMPSETLLACYCFLCISSHKIGLRYQYCDKYVHFQCQYSKANIKRFLSSIFFMQSEQSKSFVNSPFTRRLSLISSSVILSLITFLFKF